MKTKAVKTPPERTQATPPEAVPSTDSADSSGLSSCLEPVVLMVRRQFKEGGDLITDPEETTEEMAVQDFAVDPAAVHLRVNHTNNMGNFWSMSVQVGIDVPCYREEYTEAFEFASKVVAERLALELEKGKERTEEMRKRRGAGTNLF